MIKDRKPLKDWMIKYGDIKNITNESDESEMLNAIQEGMEALNKAENPVEH